MPSRKTSTAFSLPVLLSFNEFAWIMIFGMGLLCAYTLTSKANADKEILKLKDELRREKQTSEGLRTEVARLQEITEILRGELASVRAELGRAIERLRQSELRLREAAVEISGLQQALSEAQRKNMLLAEDLDKGRLEIEALKAMLEEEKKKRILISGELADANERLKAPKENAIRQELLGLKGEMSKVVIILDRSGSMNKRWTETVRVADTWLKHLAVQECAFIAFNETWKAYPENGQMYSLDGEAGEKNRLEMIQQLELLKPEGPTNTYGALEAAYAYKDVKTIILFTDGQPTVQNGVNSSSESRLMKNVLELARKNSQRGISVNTVGLGEYYKEAELTEFLMKLSSENNGVFLGR